MPNYPKPAALKTLNGNPGHRAIPIEPEPLGDVQKPDGLSGRIGEIWDFYAPILISMGTLKAPDAAMFANWCRLCALSEINFAGMTGAQLTEMRQLAHQFGMTPLSRASLGASAAKQPDSNIFLKNDRRTAA